MKKEKGAGFLYLNLHRSIGFIDRFKHYLVYESTFATRMCHGNRDTRTGPLRKILRNKLLTLRDKYNAKTR